MGGFLNVANTEESFTYMPLSGYTTVDLGCKRGNNAYTLINRLKLPFLNNMRRFFRRYGTTNQRFGMLPKRSCERLL